MCRAVWIIVVGASEDACKRLRRAAGVEAQVVGITTSADEAVTLLEGANADAVLVDSAVPGAEALTARVRERAPGIAVVWIGAGPPPGAHASVASSEELGDVLPGAITKALLARRAT